VSSAPETSLPTSDARRKPQLSIVIVQTKASALGPCLRALASQRNAPDFEVLLPVAANGGDAFQAQIREQWAASFADLRFPDLDALAPVSPHARGSEARATTPDSERHLIYDRQRCAGLAAARADIIALTEDNTEASADWCAQILAQHAERENAAIGGAIDASADADALAYAVYLSDFARYQSPLPETTSPYLSDVNVSYKAAAIARVRHVWSPSFHETGVHAALVEQGERLWASPKIRVTHSRQGLRFGEALRERFAWGRLYAAKRIGELSALHRWGLAFAMPLLPPLLLSRAIATTWTRSRERGRLLRSLPFLGALLVSWSCGEAVGIWTGRPSAGSPRVARSA